MMGYLFFSTIRTDKKKKKKDILCNVSLKIHLTFQLPIGIVSGGGTLIKLISLIAPGIMYVICVSDNLLSCFFQSLTRQVMFVNYILVKK